MDCAIKMFLFLCAGTFPTLPSAPCQIASSVVSRSWSQSPPTNWRNFLLCSSSPNSTRPAWHTRHTAAPSKTFTGTGTCVIFRRCLNILWLKEQIEVFYFLVWCKDYMPDCFSFLCVGILFILEETLLTTPFIYKDLTINDLQDYIYFVVYTYL